jgi:nuclear GTP-binding protein
MPKVRTKTSNRITIRKKYSVAKKVTDHHKKLRKEIKKMKKGCTNTQKPSKVKKGLPNSYPFKGDVLDQIEADETFMKQVRENNNAITKAKKTLPNGVLENYMAEVKDGKTRT